jgi:hypothetical protein
LPVTPVTKVSGSGPSESKSASNIANVRAKPDDIGGPQMHTKVSWRWYGHASRLAGGQAALRWIMRTAE